MKDYLLLWSIFYRKIYILHFLCAIILLNTKNNPSLTQVKNKEVYFNDETTFQTTLKIKFWKKGFTNAN